MCVLCVCVLCVCVVCVVIPFIMDVRLMDAPAEVTHDEGHTGFLHLPSAVIALILIARRIQQHPFPSLTVRSDFVDPRINPSPLVGHDFCIFIFCEEKKQFV